MKNFATKSKLAAAVLACGLLPAASQADLYIDLRLADGSKTAAVTSGQTVTFNIYAIATGADATSNEGVQSVGGSLLSGFRGITGTIGAPGALATNFTGGTGAQIANTGAIDLDGDGDLDRGQVNNNSAANFIVFRSNNMETGGTATTYNGAAGNEYLLGQATFTVGALDNTMAGTTLTWRPRLNLNGSLAAAGASYRKDGAGSVTALNGGVYAGGHALTLVNAAAEGFTLTTASANTNLATGGSVQVTGADGYYTSEVDELTANAGKGSVTFNQPISGQSTLLLWLGDSNVEGGATIQSTLADLQANGGGTYTILQAGNATFDAFNAEVGGTATAAVQFAAGSPIEGAFNWNFGDSRADIYVDRVALAPEPASLGLIGMIGAGLLARRRRITQ